MMSMVSLCISIKCVKGALQMEKVVAMFPEKCVGATSKSKNERNIACKTPPRVTQSSVAQSKTTAKTRPSQPCPHLFEGPEKLPGRTDHKSHCSSAVLSF